MKKTMQDKKLENNIEQAEVARDLEQVIKKSGTDVLGWTRQYKTGTYKKALQDFPKWVIEGDSFFHLPTETYQKLISFKYESARDDLIPKYPAWVRVNKWLTYMHDWTPYTSKVDVPIDTPAPNTSYWKKNIDGTQCHVWVKMQTNLDLEMAVAPWFTQQSAKINYSETIPTTAWDYVTKIIQINKTWSYKVRSQFLVQTGNQAEFYYDVLKPDGSIVEVTNQILMNPWTQTYWEWVDEWWTYYSHYIDVDIQEWDKLRQVVTRFSWKTWTIQSRQVTITFDVVILIPWSSWIIIQEHS